MKKKCLCALLACFLAVGATGCGSSSGSSSAASPSSAPSPSSTAPASSSSAAPAAGSEAPAEGAGLSTTGEISMWLGSWWEDQAPTIIEAYKKANPNVTLTIEALPINGYMDKAVTTVLSGDGPDVLALDVGFMGTLVNKNLLLPWDDKIAGMDLSDFASVVKGGIFDGKYYGLPYRASGSVLFYNKTMFDAAGVEYPKGGETYAQILEIAKKLTIPGQQYGYGISAGLSDISNVFSTFSPVLWSFGAEYTNEDETVCTLDTPEAIEAIAFWTGLYTTDKVVPEGAINYTMTKDIQPMFIENKVAMQLGGDNNYAEFIKHPDLKFGFVDPPEGPVGTGGWLFTVPVTAKNPDAAFEFALWFLEPENLGELTVRIPSRTSATQYGQWNDPLYQTIVRSSLNGKLNPGTAAWSDMQKVIATELQNIMQGAKSVETGAADMTRQCNDLLKANS